MTANTNDFFQLKVRVTNRIREANRRCAYSLNVPRQFVRAFHDPCCSLAALVVGR
jgi:hypothetical protein